VGKNGGKVEATFQVASNKGWLEIAKTLNIYISAPREAREDLSPVLACSVCALLYYSTFGEQSQRCIAAFSVKRMFGEKPLR